MASAMVNSVAPSPPPEAFPWLSPRISFSHDPADPPSVILPGGRPDDSEASPDDFEFHLHDDPVAMLPADELFSGGKLVPLQLAPPKPAAEVELEPSHAAEIGMPEPPETRRKTEIAGSDPYAFSPRAPRCTTRWRELLGLKRAWAAKPGVQVTPAALAPATSKNPNPRSSLKHLLHRHPKLASLDASLSLPLLRDSDHESAAIASRLSLSSSSSSSGPDHEDLARLSMESDKPRHAPPRVRLVRPRPAAPTSSWAGLSPTRRTAEPAPAPPPRGVSVDSPRMSSSGKIVFQGLERSSSSPGSFTGGPRPRPRGVERSYSANVRVAPVLNVVPVCSLRGSGKPVSVFGLAHIFSPQQKKDRDGSTSNRTELARSVRRQRRQEQDRHPSPKQILENSK